MSDYPGNRRVGWLCIAVGISSGLLMGLWSFDGPLTPPAFLGDYGTTARRLLRLGHIAWIGLGILNLLLARELPVSALSGRGKRAAAVLMNIGNVALPLTLFAASLWRPLKYAMAPAATCVFIAVVLVAVGARDSSGSSGEAPR